MKVIDISVKKSEQVKMFNQLLNEVLERSPKPHDAMEIAAILESIGWNDERVSTALSVGDVFELSKIIWETLKKRITVDEIQNNSNMKAKSESAVRSFLRGMIFALPMAISVFSMLTIRFSLWSYQYLSTEYATSIAIGTIMSFVSVGGFMQAIARRGFFYMNQGFYSMARRTSFYFVKAGCIFCSIVGLFFLLVNWFFKIFPFDMTAIIILYFVFLSINWLSVTMMYILKKELIFTGLMMVGIGIVFVFFRILHLDIIPSQIIGLAVIAVLGMGTAYGIFRKKEGLNLGKGDSIMPRTSIMLYSIMPYFMYGLFYFSFLFIDRVIAWSRYDIYMPYFIWFRGNYELGLDFGILMLIIPMGFNEIVVNRLMIYIRQTQMYSYYKESELENRKYTKMYFKSFLTVVRISVLSAIAIYMIITYINSIKDSYLWTGFLLNQTTLFVFIAGLVSYSILCIGLMNAVMLFSLSQPDIVLKTTIYALIINAVFGFLLSRWLDYSFAVMGILAGSIYFAVKSTISTVMVMKNIDYYIYAAS